MTVFHALFIILACTNAYTLWILLKSGKDINILYEGMHILMKERPPTRGTTR